MKSIISTTAAVFVASATFASAAFLEIDGGVGGSIPGTETNDVLADMGIGSLDGFYGGQIETSGGFETLRIELLGFEAGNANTFVYDGTTLFDTEDFGSDTVLPGGGNNGQVEVSGYSLSGLLDFLFTTNGEFPNNIPQTVENGSNTDNTDPTIANFFASFGDDSREGNVLYLFFDDVGAQDDDNHDDLVIRISAVPLPMSGLLLLAGLGGLGAAARRRKA